jgi:hypothetical protein
MLGPSKSSAEEAGGVQGWTASAKRRLLQSQCQRILHPPPPAPQPWQPTPITHGRGHCPRSIVGFPLQVPSMLGSSLTIKQWSSCRCVAASASCPCGGDLKRWGWRLRLCSVGERWTKSYYSIFRCYLTKFIQPWTN